MTSNRADNPLTWLDGTKYRARRVVGKGAMGVVLAAEHEGLGREVCVKVLRPEASGHQGLIDRFRLEAQALAKLGGGKHANLLHVSDFGVTPAGYWFLAMELLVGRTLDQERRARGPIPWGEACQLMLQALAGLAVAHDAGVVHRDIKPANLFVCDPVLPGGPRVVKVLDFGIIKLVEMAKLAGEVTRLQVPTAAGIAIGTPRYMAPEQLRAAPLDARADIFGMALVFWSLLSGRIPHEGREAEALIQAQVSEPLQPLADYAIVPDALIDLIARASAKKKEDRPRDAADFAHAIEEATRQPGSTTTLAPSQSTASRATGARPTGARPTGARPTGAIGPRGTELVLEAPAPLPILPEPAPRVVAQVPMPPSSDEASTARLVVATPRRVRIRLAPATAPPESSASWWRQPSRGLFAVVVVGAALLAAICVLLLARLI